MSNNQPTLRELAVNTLGTAQFMVQRGLRVCDLRQALKVSRATINKIDAGLLNEALPEARRADFAGSSLEAYFDSLMAKYKDIRNYPSDIAVFTQERAALTAGYGAAIKVAEAMQESDFETEKGSKQPTVLNYKGEDTFAIDIANSIMEPVLKQALKDLGGAKAEPNALFKLCNAIARAVGSKGVLRPEFVETGEPVADEEAA